MSGIDTELMTAIEALNPDKTAAAIAKAAGAATSRTPKGESLLHILVHASSTGGSGKAADALAVGRLLIRSGVPFDAQDAHGQTALVVASKEGEIVAINLSYCICSNYSCQCHSPLNSVQPSSDCHSNPDAMLTYPCLSLLAKPPPCHRIHSQPLLQW